MNALRPVCFTVTPFGKKKTDALACREPRTNAVLYPDVILCHLA